MEEERGEADVWFYKGNEQYLREDFEDALASYDQTIKFKPDFHEAWLGRGGAAGKSVNYDPLPSLRIGILQKNPALNERGYEGRLISYEEGLKYCTQETHPEGWGLLNQAIGNAHYYRGRGDSRPRSYWYKAANSYNQALKTLTKDAFPEAHLDVLKDLSRVRFDLGENAKAEELQRLGSMEVFAGI